MIETHELTKYFNNFLAVDHITFNVEPGTIFAILGPNPSFPTCEERRKIARSLSSKGEHGQTKKVVLPCDVSTDG
jgi:ABC-2 type transport system ATP-binding protein